MPKYLGETFFGNLQVIKSEYINQSIEEHFSTIDYSNMRVSTLRDMMMQMFDGIHMLHREAKLLHKDIKPDNFRIQDGQVKMIDFGLVTDYLDKDGIHYP